MRTAVKYKYQFGSCEESGQRRIDADRLTDALNEAVGDGLAEGIRLGLKYGCYRAALIIFWNGIKDIWRQRKK